MRLYLWIGFLLAAAGVQAQPLNRILAVVDEEVVLQSDVDAQHDYMIKGGQKDDGSMRCTILENLLTAKLLLARARLDSLKVTDEQVDEEWGRRLQTMMQQVGGEEELIKIYGKSVVEIKLELRPEIREQLLIDAQRNKIFENIKMTPRDVKIFFANIPKDSLPYLPAEVEISHIVLRPKPSAPSLEKTRKELDSIRVRILRGDEPFDAAARFYSVDYTSAKKGGSLGKFTRGQMVPEFEEVVFNLKPSEISKVFPTSYGFHIIRLDDRKGDIIEASHILLRPAVDKNDVQRSLERLKQIRAAIVRDSIRFAVAAAAWSEDRQTKDNGGRFITSQGEHRVPLDKLDADLYLKIDEMKEGEISEPLEMVADFGELTRAWHIIWLQRKLPPHRANLQDDYQKFYKAARQARQTEELNKWFLKAKKQIFVEIKSNECSQALENWN